MSATSTGDWEKKISSEIKRLYPNRLVFISFDIDNSMNRVVAYEYKMSFENKIFCTYASNSISDILKEVDAKRGVIYLAKFENGKFIEKTELTDLMVKETSECNVLVYLYRHYNYELSDIKIVMQAIEREKEYKGRLIEYCYKNDTDNILKRVKKADEEELNQKIKYVGTPLELCAQNKNFEGFKAIAEKGASITKSNWKDGNFKDAFRYSPEIAHFIAEKYPKEFKNVVKRLGYSVASSRRKDTSLLDLIKNAGANPNLIIDGHPSVENFIYADNEIAMEYLINNGLDLKIVDKNGKSLLDIAKKEKAKKVISLLSNKGVKEPKADKSKIEKKQKELLEKIEKTTKIKLPEELKQLYLLSEEPCVNDVDFMKLEDILKEIDYAKFDKDAPNDDSIKSEKKNVIKTKMYLKERIPFIQDYGGNFIGIDYVPDSAGTVGQIITYGRDEDVMLLLANSFKDFLNGLKGLPERNKNVYIVDYLSKNKIRFIKNKKLKKGEM